MFTEDEEEEEEEEQQQQKQSHETRYCYVDHESCERDHLVADIIGGGQSLVFHHTTSFSEEDQFISPRESLVQEEQDNHYYASDQTISVHRSPKVSDFETEEEEEVVVDDDEADSVPNSVPIMQSRPTSPITLNLYKNPDGMLCSTCLITTSHIHIDIINNIL